MRPTASVDPSTAGPAMELAPLAGLVLGLLAGAAGFLIRLLDGSNLLAAAVAVSVLALLTRGLHLDGVADLVDGLASYRDPEGTRAVMKRPDIGPMGVVALALLLLVQVAALEQCYANHRGTACLVLAVATGRVAITAACRRTPAATIEGLGAMVATTVRPGVTSLWVALLAVGFGAYAVVDPHGESVGIELLRTTAAIALGLLTARLLRAHAVRRVGGLTGDVLGALAEAATTVALVVLALGS